MSRKPNDFNGFPYGSVLQNVVAEIVARNIMTILKRTGNEFYLLTWEEYKAERLKDGDFSNEERPFFNQVQIYVKSASTAATFSPQWATSELKSTCNST